jgi:hypothetical protein
MQQVPLEKLIVLQLVKEFPAFDRMIMMMMVMMMIIIIIIIIHLTASGPSPAGSGYYAFT